MVPDVKMDMPYDQAVKTVEAALSRLEMSISEL